MATDRELRDALKLLAERAPATCPTPGEESFVARRPSSVPTHRRPWGLLVTAAALVVLVAGIIVYTVGGLSGGNGDSAPADSHGLTTRVTCTAPSGHAVDADRDAISKRTAALRASDVDVMATGSTLQASMRGVTASAVAQLCASGTVDLRGVVAPPVSVTCSGASCSSGAVAQAARDGQFTVPLTDTDYAKLTAVQQHQLAVALAGFDCSSAANAQQATGYLVACADGAGFGAATGHVAVLLGSPVVTGSQFDTATAEAPNPQAGSVTWTIALTLSPAGASRWTSYTTAHNAGGNQGPAPVLQCGLTTTPCADYVGFTLDGSIISIPVTITAIRGASTQLAGNFTAASAKALAANLQGGALPVPLKLDSVRTVK